MYAEDYVMWGVGLVVVAILGWTIYAFVASARSPVIEIQKSEWSCTEKSTRVIMLPISVGKTTVMRPQPMTQCDKYERRP